MDIEMESYDSAITGFEKDIRTMEGELDEAL